MANSVVAHFSSGVIEISAVATLIGAPVVEAMTLGLKSAACLPWASMSSFGLLHVAKASLAAAVPDWIRDSLGLQNENVDAALGLCLPICKDKQIRSRVDLGDVKAVSRTSMHGAIKAFGGGTVAWSDMKETSACMYQLDRASKLVLDTIPPAELGKGILIHEFVEDIAGRHKLWKDWTVLLLSLSKAVEIVGLWLCGGEVLLLIFTAIPWGFAFVGGLVLLSMQQSRDHYSATQTDVVTGQLPSPLHQGSGGKVIIGMPRNSRRSRAWRIIWTIYAPITMIGIVGTFIVLGRNNAKAIYLWMAFQTLWLLVRTTVFYFVESAAGTRQSLVAGRAWETASSSLKKRTLRLILTLSKQQTSLHPRGVGQYVHDLLDQEVIRERFDGSGWALTDGVKVDDEASLNGLRVDDVVGDTVLRSVSWIRGATLDNNELYDSSLVFLQVAGKRMAVPSVRVCICRCPRMESKDWARGDSHGEICKKMKWVLWIPVMVSSRGEKKWIQAEGTKTRGNLELQCLSSDQLDRSLADGELLVSLKGVGELEPILGVSRTASQLLMSMVLAIASSERMVQVEEKV